MSRQCKCHSQYLIINSNRQERLRSNSLQECPTWFRHLHSPASLHEQHDNPYPHPPTNISPNQNGRSFLYPRPRERKWQLHEIHLPALRIRLRLRTQPRRNALLPHPLLPLRRSLRMARPPHTDLVLHRRHVPRRSERNARLRRQNPAAPELLLRHGLQNERRAAHVRARLLRCRHLLHAEAHLSDLQFEP